MSITFPRWPSPRPAQPRRAARLAIASLALVLVAPLGAQQATPVDSLRATVTLAGVVRDTAGHTLSGAEVRAGADQFTITGTDGQFVLQGVAPDTIQLLVRRIGYQPAEVVLEAAAGLRVELAVKLVPAVTQLGTITIEGRQMDTRLWRTGFYDRQQLGWGTLFGPDKLERYGATLSGIMHEVPSVHVTYGRGGTAVAYGPGRVGGECPLMVFLDGIYIRWAGEVGLDQLVNRQDVLALEVYPRATDVPSNLSSLGGVDGASAGVPSPTAEAAAGLPPSPGASAGPANVGPVDCGAIMIWTKPF
jgi:hypothetical protein